MPLKKNFEILNNPLQYPYRNFLRGDYMDSSALKNEFLIESFENLSTISEDLTQLEKDPENMDLLNKLYRTVHTMKGSASFLGYKVLQDITHSGENLLDALRERKFLTNSEIIDTLFETFDICHAILKSLEVNDVEGDIEIESNKKRLVDLLNSNGAGSSNEQEISAQNSVKEIPNSDVIEIEKDPLTDDELSSLISGFRESENGGGGPEKVEVSTPSTPSEDQDSSGMSAAALDSLKELVGDGKVDPKVIAELEAESSPSPEPTKKTENLDMDSETLSSAALDSLKELVGDGKIDASVMASLQADFGGADTAPVKTEEVKKPEPVKPEPVKAEPTKVEAVKKEELVKPKVSSSDILKKADTPSTQEKAEPAKKETAPEPKAKSRVEIDDTRKSLADQFVRVNVKVLDKIMNIVGELVLNRNQILQFSNIQEDHTFSKLAQQLNIITSELQSEVMATRMQPIGSILTKFERLVRDFSRQNNKKISLKLSGQDTELDKTLIEAIKDPLVHIIRNACDHGMETIEEREKTGKVLDGTVHIKSYNESGQVTVEIVDDGRGLNRERIGQKAIEKNLITPEKYEKMTDTQVYNLIFAPGFSTAEKITNISGRGVGMDVVKTNIEKIGGSVIVTSEYGVGTTFKLRIPLTLAIVPALIIKSSNESFAIPQLNLVELVRLETEEEKQSIEMIQGSEFLKLRGSLTPVFRLSDQLNLQSVHDKSQALQAVVEKQMIGDASRQSFSVPTQTMNKQDGSYNIVILNAENHYFGIIVDEILDTEEIVVKPLSSALKQLSLFGGATIMGDGKVALILDAMGFLNTVHDSLQSITTENSDVDSEVLSEFKDGSELQENLLFKLFDGREYAVPLSLVSRLEEISISNIEFTGSQPIVRYLNAPMPLINIEKTLRLNGKSILESFKDEGVEAVSCIVTTIQGRHYGIVVNEVNDISIDKVVIDDTAVDREGILGTIFIHGKTISLIDLYAVIQAQNLGNFKSEKHVKKASNREKRVLVVDDSPMYRKMEGDLLEGMGFDVTLANHGQDALQLLQDSHYDLLITDIEMPFLNGYELAQKVREEIKNTEIPILALSTRCSEADIEKGKVCGFNHHMEKFKKFEVADKVVEILGVR